MSNFLFGLSWLDFEKLLLIRNIDILLNNYGTIIIKIININIFWQS